MGDPTWDVAIVGGGPAGATAAAFCARRGLRTIVLEREVFPREKVCGDCLNPACWPILGRLGLAERLRLLPCAPIETVDFISLRRRRLSIRFPRSENGEIAIKRSIFDALLLGRAGELGADVHDRSTLTALVQRGDYWEARTSNHLEIRARVLIAADGRNSTVARLLKWLPPVPKERIALQAHISLPSNFGNRIVLQWLPGGYSGQVPVNDRELNVCLVARPGSIRCLQAWATREFGIQHKQSWRTITPLQRAPLRPARDNVFLVGDAARVVEPFTGEGIFYAMRSGEIAAAAAEKLLRGGSAPGAHLYEQQHAAIYRGRLWINALARIAVRSPRMGSLLLELARFQPGLLRFLTAKVISV